LRQFLIRRLILIIPVLLGAMTGVFLLVHFIPGDVAAYVAGEHASQAVVAVVRERMGLNDPMHVQYWRFISGAFRGDLGRSLVNGTPVATQMAQAFPNTLILTGFAVLWAVSVGVVLGVLSASMRGSLLDRGIMSLAVFGVSIPGFAIALGLMYLLAFKLDLFPLGGAARPLLSLKGIHHLILPGIALGLELLASVSRMTRSTVLDILNTDYIRTAKAKGLPYTRVLFKHALRPALLPVITLVGVSLTRLLSGAVVIETVFAWPGLGRLVIASILVKDLPMIQGVMLLKVGLSVGLNLLVDTFYGVVDPRVRYS